MSNQTTSMSQAVDNYVEKIRSEQAALILDISKQLDDSISDMLSRIEEDKFALIFLPMFAGIPESERVYKNVTLRNWLNLASAESRNPHAGLYLEVIVIDKMGRELFRVPPLADSSAIKPDHVDSRFGLGDLLKHAHIQGNNIPRAAEIEFMRLCDHYQKENFVDNKNKEVYVQRWNDIFKRYGYDKYLNLQNNSTAPSSETQTEDDEYENL